ncbi:MAG: hypothetical protein NZ521_08925, partial [Flammeovirgaceae bacterium]|nr:hypothetical protein [Flammeovirgaceae bacterium]MDW8288325.1 hypothetical protein [Flammeovirgaceae bacterium]
LYDSLWKGAIEDFSEAFFNYFYSPLASMIDFERLKFLNKELPNLFVEMEGDGRADLIVEAPLKNGEKVCFIFHIEIQGYHDTTFPFRMFRYYYRLMDYYGENIISLAIFTDEDPKFYPTCYKKRKIPYSSTIRLKSSISPTSGCMYKEIFLVM